MKTLALIILLVTITLASFSQDSTVIIVDTVEVTEQIADALDSLVVPIAELIADELRDAPAKGAPFTAWIGWAIGFASLLIGFLIGKFKKKK
jgi:hypothetical protein